MQSEIHRRIKDEGVSLQFSTGSHKEMTDSYWVQKSSLTPHQPSKDVRRWNGTSCSWSWLADSHFKKKAFPVCDHLQIDRMLLILDIVWSSSYSKCQTPEVQVSLEFGVLHGFFSNLQCLWTKSNGSDSNCELTSNCPLKTASNTSTVRTACDVFEIYCNVHLCVVTHIVTSG